MPIEHLPWLIPAMEEAYSHREQLASTWEKILAWLLGQKRTIAITGTPGVGKSVLFEYLTDQAFERNHPLPPQPSTHAETHKVLAPGKRIILTTIPGQQTVRRFQATAEMFSGGDPVAGVIHVAANGFASLRNDHVKQELIASGIDNVDKYRAFQMQNEIDDLKATCQLIVDSAVKHKKLIWLFVAVSKCDLYVPSLKTVESYYSPVAQNAFVGELKRLEKQLGTLLFQWDAMPVCGALEDFHWNGTTVPSKLHVTQRDKLITQLLKRIEVECAAE